MVDDETPLEVTLGAGKTLRSWEEQIGAGMRDGLGMRDSRVVFHHRDKAMAEYFWRCVQTFRWGVWDSANEGDGSVEEQWGEVFGGDPR